MALTDPQIVTIAAAPNTLPRTGTGPSSSVYLEADGDLAMTISHTGGKRRRSVARLDRTKTAADPLISAQNILHRFGVYLVVDKPVTGFTIAEQKDICLGLTAWLSDSSGANLVKFLGGES